jgi:TP901 family phage tail tape measure protein
MSTNANMTFTARLRSIVEMQGIRTAIRNTVNQAKNAIKSIDSHRKAVNIGFRFGRVSERRYGAITDILSRPANRGLGGHWVDKPGDWRASAGRARGAGYAALAVSRQMMAFSRMLSDMIQTTVRAYAEYEEQLIKIQIAERFHGSTMAEITAMMNDLTPAIDETALKWGILRSELASSVGVLRQYGMSYEDISANLNTLAEFARINFMDIGEAASAWARQMQVTRLTGQELSDWMKSLTALAKTVRVEFEDMAQGLTYVRSTSELMGFSLREVAAGLAALVQRGMSASLAGRRLDRMYNTLIQKGGEYGVVVSDANGAFLTQQEIVANLISRMGSFSTELERNQYLLALFGAEGADAARKIIEAYQTGDIAELERTVNAVMEGEGETAWQDSLLMLQESASVALDRLDVAMTMIAEEVGKTFVPKISIITENLIQHLPAIVDSIREWGDHLSNIIIILTVLTGVLGVILAVIGTILLAVALAATLIASPVWAILAAIALIAAAVATVIWLLGQLLFWTKPAPAPETEAPYPEGTGIPQWYPYGPSGPSAPVWQEPRENYAPYYRKPPTISIQERTNELLGVLIAILQGKPVVRVSQE